MLTHFEESLLTQGNASKIIDMFLKYMQHDNKLILDNPLLKNIDSHKEEVEKQVSQKVKSSLQAV